MKKIYDRKWIVIIVCLVFFPFGYYMLWKNQTFKKNTKIIFAIFSPIMNILFWSVALILFTICAQNWYSNKVAEENFLNEKKRIEIEKKRISEKPIVSQIKSFSFDKQELYKIWNSPENIFLNQIKIDREMVYYLDDFDTEIDSALYVIDKDSILVFDDEITYRGKINSLKPNNLTITWNHSQKKQPTLYDQTNIDLKAD